MKDWVRQMCSRIRCVAENPQSEANNKPIEVEMADNDYFFNSKKYKSLLEAAKDCGISNNFGQWKTFCEKAKRQKNILCETRELIILKE